jgi:hypothetical protein
MDPNSSLANRASAQKIVGIYLTELDYIMVKIAFSDGTHMNKPIGKLSDLLSSDLNCLERDLSEWNFKKDHIR